MVHAGLGRFCLRHPTLRLSSEPADTTPYGGLALAVGLVRSLDIARDLDRELSLLAPQRPFHESDHVLTHVYNLYAGGTCIEDIADLQTSEPVRRILGADRIPDPTAAANGHYRGRSGICNSRSSGSPRFPISRIAAKSPID